MTERGDCVSVLTSSSGSVKPLHPEVRFRPSCKWGRGGGVALAHHRNGHGRRVDAATPFRRRHSLDPVAARLVSERVAAFALDREADRRIPAGGRNFDGSVARSAFGETKTLVSPRKVAHEQLRVVAALGGPDFNGDGGHVRFLLFQSMVTVRRSPQRASSTMGEEVRSNLVHDELLPEDGSGIKPGRAIVAHGGSC